MPNLVIPAGDIVTVASGASGNLIRKKASEIRQGEYAWCFVVESYLPFVTGHFRFIEVTGQPANRTERTHECRWFNQQDGPAVHVPNEWVLISGSQLLRLDQQKQMRGYALPGYLHDIAPLAINLELFFGSTTSNLLTEQAAYFLGAFAVKPQCYVVGNDTWGIFGVRFNREGEFGVSKQPPTAIASWLASHRFAVEKLAKDLWGEGHYFVEQKGGIGGIVNEPVPPDHQRDRILKAVTSQVGFAIHAPIALDMQLRCDGTPNSSDLRVLQYWYSCLISHMIERTTISTRKAFLLGALDMVSNADKDRKSIGIDWPDGFVGEFPMYSAIHSVGRNILDTFEGEETSNPRKTPARTRGRIPRCKIYEMLQEIGFISELRLTRARRYDPSISGIPIAVFPSPGTLSVILGVDVAKIVQGSGHGSTEEDITEHRLYRTGSKGRKEFIHVPIDETNAYAVCSLPLGSLSPPMMFPTAPASRNQVQLARSGWIEDAIDKVTHINRHLPPAADAPPEDMIFEYLIAVLVSRLNGCIESWVIPRHDDQGVDVGATFHTGADELGNVTTIFQAKLQASPVGRRVIDQLRGSFHREKGVIGFVVTSSRFTIHATRSSSNDYPEVRLIDGKKLISMLCEKRVGFFVAGRGIRQRFFMDLTFFDKLRDLVIATRKMEGRIRVGIDPYDMPAMAK